MDIFPYDFPPDRLQLRLDFLKDRAKAHLDELENDGERKDAILLRACAATLLRDAACVALLLEKPGEACKLLHQSGKHYLTLGILVGASFIALAGEASAEKELNAHDDLIEATRQQRSWKEAREQEMWRRPMAEYALGEPRQLLAIAQADWLVNKQRGQKDDYSFNKPIFEALHRSGGHPTGVTGLTIDSYINSAEFLSRYKERDYSIPQKNCHHITTMMAIRAENLRAARKDQYHWNLLARPAELIDLDATILLYLATDQFGLLDSGVAELLQPGRDELPLLYAPAQAAAAIRHNQNSERH